MKALITGISGFVGSYLAEYLLDNTDWQVAGTVFGPYTNIADLCGRLELYPAELSRLDVVTFVLDRCQPDVILHLAGQPLVSLSRQDPWGTMETNIHVPLSLLEGVARMRPECRVLLVGSSEVYGNVAADRLPVDEDTPFCPLNAYAVSKITQDLLGLQYHLANGLHVVRVRPFNHIGPRQRLGFVAPDLARQIAAIELGLQPPVMHVGSLSSRRDFSDVRDVVRAYYLAITRGGPGQVYNVGSGRSHSIEELLHILLDYSGADIEVQQDPELLRQAELSDIVCDASRLRRETGWEPQIPFEQSLRDVLDYWRAELRREINTGN